MDEETFEAELERRLRTLDEADTGRASLPALPARDVWIAVVGLVLLSALLTWWGYPA